MGAVVQVKGLRELQRDFRKMSKDLAGDLRKRLKGIGQIVADEAQRIAAARGLKDSGDLIRLIRPTVKANAVSIRASAKRRGFNYPVRYELGDRQRPFLVPARERKQPEVIRRLEDMVDDLADRYGF